MLVVCLVTIVILIGYQISNRGDLTVNQATEIFENMRSALINAKARDMEEELEEGKKEGKGL
jgi:hypothetical protein